MDGVQNSGDVARRKETEKGAFLKTSQSAL